MVSLQQEFTTYEKQAVLVPGDTDKSDAGQCFQWFDYVLHDVYGLPYIYASGAINIWEDNESYSLKPYFDFIPYSPTMPIKLGDIVVYGTGVGSPFGHVSIAATDGVGNNYTGYDSNWGHNLTVHAVSHDDSYNQYILGILRLKSNNGGTMPDDTPDANQLKLTIAGMWGPYPASEADITKITSQPTTKAALNLIVSDNRCNLWLKQQSAAFAGSTAKPTVVVNGVTYSPES